MGDLRQSVRVILGVAVLAASSVPAQFTEFDDDFSSGMSGWQVKASASIDETVGGDAPPSLRITAGASRSETNRKTFWSSPTCEFPGPFYVSFWAKMSSAAEWGTCLNVWLNGPSGQGGAWIGMYRIDAPWDPEGGLVSFDVQDIKSVGYNDPHSGGTTFEARLASVAGNKGWNLSDCTELVIWLWLEVKNGDLWVDDIRVSEQPVRVDPRELTVLGAPRNANQNAAVLRIAPNGRVVHDTPRRGRIASGCVVRLQNGSAFLEKLIRE